MSDDHDTAMCGHAKRRARIIVTQPGRMYRTGILIAWRPHREQGGTNVRRYTARVHFDGQLSHRTVDLKTCHIEVLP